LSAVVKSAPLSESRTIRVLVVEDDFYSRLGTVAFLAGQHGIEVVGEAADGERALTLFERLRPDVVVLNPQVERREGPRLAAALARRSPAARVLVLTRDQGDGELARALEAGVRGYVSKTSPGEQLVAGIRAVHAGESFLPVQASARGARPPHLTPREREVLLAVADGASNREAARAMGIAERTVAVFVSSILTKLGAASRTEAVALARRLGLLQA
jgi:DNA-binding NarL/FixJ family response regulator